MMDAVPKVGEIAKYAASQAVCCGSLSLIFFGIVVGNISKEQFELVFAPNGIHYYNFMLSTFIFQCISIGLACIVCATVKDDATELNGPQKMSVSGQQLSGIAAVIAQYVFLGQLWYADPDHTICFNNHFWNTQARGHGYYGNTYDGLTIGDEGAYLCAEVLLRLSAFFLMMLPVFLACFCCCWTGAFACGLGGLGAASNM